MTIEVALVTRSSAPVAKQGTRLRPGHGNKMAEGKSSLLSFESHCYWNSSMHSDEILR